TAGRVAVSPPLRAVGEARTGRGHLGAEGGVPGDVVRAARVPAEVGQGPEAVVVDQVAGQLAHAGDVVAADVRGREGLDPGQGDDRALPGQARQLVGPEYRVVQDRPVALAGEGEDAPAVVVVAGVHRAHQQVEVPPLGGHLDAPVDEIRKLEALLLV